MRRSTTRSWGGRALAAAVAVTAVAVVPGIAAAQFGQADLAGQEIAAGSTAASGDTSGDQDTLAASSTLGSSETGRWIVQLDEPSLATYDGGIADLSATDPQVTGAPKLDVTSSAARSYADHLQARQATFADTAGGELGREVAIERTYSSVLNAVVIEADRSEAVQLSALPGVAAVYPDELRELTTDVSHEAIGSAAIWGGETGSQVGTRGEGVLVGILDSGVNPEHPSFAATDGTGYQHENPLGDGTYLGVCDPSNSRQPDEAICNDKLVGAWSFDYREDSAIDSDGHGSHTASTAAGNVHDATFTIGDTSFTREVSGVAPRANIVAYRVCLNNCPITAILAGIDQAVTDGVDVINFSIAGSDSPWTDPVSVGFLEAANAGIFVAAAAGNEGPGESTTAHSGPWITAVAASTTSRVFAQTLDVTTAGAPEGLSGLAAVPSGDGPGLTNDLEAPIRDAEAVASGNGNGCAAFPGGVFEGSVALIERGACDFSAKVSNAASAGADAVVVFSDSVGPPTTMGGLAGTSVPAVMIGRSDGLALREHVTGADTQVRLNAATSLVTDEEWANSIAGFSSRGPSQHDLISPTITAPGVNILAANAGDADSYMVQQGTSMASPHVAGAGALMTALHPDWTPMQIRSALASSANPDVLSAGADPTTAFDQGSGLLDLGAAGRVGLVLDETYENFKAANPAPGFDGDPQTLNVPALVDQECGSACTWTRTVTNVADTSVTYTAAGESADGVSVQVEPATITLAPGESAAVEIMAQAGGLPIGEWAFGSVTWSTDGTYASGVPVADATFPMLVQSTAAQLEVDPGEVAAEQEPDTVTEHTVTIGNTGGQGLEWNVVEETGEQAITLRPVTGTPVTASALPKDRTLPGQGELLEPARNSGTVASGIQTQVERPAADEGSVTMTHSESQAVLANNTVACSAEDGLTGDNGFLRTFTLTDFAIADEFAVTDVSFGVEAVNGAPANVTVRLYTLDGETLTYDNLTQIGSSEVTLQPQALQMVSVPVTGTAPAGSTLVVELDAPSTSETSGFFAGSNAEGESAPSYLRSVDCGMPEPAPMSVIGFPDTHLVLNVTGTTDAPDTQLPEWLTMEPMSGTVPAGQTQDVTVTIDSAGLSAGDIERTIAMLASNDPDQPTTSLPISLTVSGDGSEPPVDGASQDIVATVPQDGGGEDGSLLISVDPQDRTVELPEMASQGDRLATSGELRPVMVTDSRTADPGWNVSAQVSDFAGSDEGLFAGGFLGWAPSVESSSDGQAVTPGDVVAPGFPSGEGLSVPRPMGSAEPGSGRGSATLGAGLDLQVPMATTPGVYTAILTITAL
ncbi:S8 family serine peptidase [Ornithinimicrobium faecis]|uniref:S8 family serine peptidase n=1 Tax=Ornithinimicrobium faecis TaxID=2934158 RepID=UPI0025AB7043|nr:S8 family serine peptidase [Ornithinimicrobium sp. HY1793]